MRANKNRKAFTMIELIFVIVIMAILAKFGVEFVAQSYSSFINSQINNELQSNSATAVEFVATRLQHRIKPSAIAREDDGTFTPLKDYAIQVQIF
jgi:prepilin-type N-terminal cleavage/methylation domain-containing protein